MPGHAKIVSVTTAPVRTTPNCSPRTVTTGIRRTGHGLDHEHRWDVFWDAPLNHPEEIRRSRATIHSDRCMVRTDGARLEVTFPGLERTLPLAPTPIELSETPGAYRRPAPRIGEHTDEILRGLGYDEAEISALRAEKII